MPTSSGKEGDNSTLVCFSLWIVAGFAPGPPAILEGPGSSNNSLVVFSCAVLFIWMMREVYWVLLASSPFVVGELEPALPLAQDIPGRSWVIRGVVKRVVRAGAGGERRRELLCRAIIVSHLPILHPLLQRAKHTATPPVMHATTAPAVLVCYLLPPPALPAPFQEGNSSNRRRRRQRRIHVPRSKGQRSL